MHLVYRAMEKEPVPSSLPASLIPPSKRKKLAVTLPGAVAVLPVLSGFTSASAPLKDALRSTPPPLLGSAAPISTSAVSLSPKHSFKSSSTVRRLAPPYCCNCITTLVTLGIIKCGFMVLHHTQVSHTSSFCIITPHYVQMCTSLHFWFPLSIMIYEECRSFADVFQLCYWFHFLHKKGNGMQIVLPAVSHTSLS